MAAKIRKGDRVVVIAGKYKGVEGEVLRSVPTEDRVVVQGVNVRVKHRRPTQANPQGGIERIEAPIHVSNIAAIDPSSGKPTRVGFKVLEDGRKVRVARSGQVLDQAD